MTSPAQEPSVQQLPTKGLCEVCATAFGSCIIDTWADDPPTPELAPWGAWTHRFVLHHSLAAFCDAVDKKCFICCSAILALERHHQDLLTTIAESEHLTTSGNDGCAVSDFLVCPDSHAPDDLRMFPFLYIIVSSNLRYFDELGLIKLDEKPEPPSSTFEWVTSNITSNSTASDEAYDHMAKWLRDCESQHEHCQNRASDDIWHPTRLLDIGITSKVDIKMVTKIKSQPRADMSPSATAGTALSQPSPLTHWQAGLKKSLLNLSERFPEQTPYLGRCRNTRFKDFPNDSLQLLASSAAHGIEKASEKNSNTNHQACTVLPSPTATACYHTWVVIIHTYVRCQLTFASDKLVAITSVARYLKGFCDNDLYIMGLWNFNIAGQNTASDLPPAFHIPGQNDSVLYRALSFSWASVNAVCTFPKVNQPGILVTATCIQYRSSGADQDLPIEEDIIDSLPTGPTVELKVVGRLIRAKLLHVGEQSLIIWPQDLLPGTTNNGLTADKKNPPPPTDNSGVWKAAELDFDIGPDPDVVPSIAKRQFYYMPWQEDFRDNPRQDLHGFQCLVLELVDQSMGRFRRVGIM
ncbi:hypothetical protein B0H63DRAFT_523595 [Podospora didyma]|uniref:Heterokaryon incompatibility domain-containing protein n=1 Tax=Podospora didyma TaxID=330526 RepID=A0AAE0NG44_9PEZI|nr:hypothetical protein B0H63DRAFT_523595 [Podospora didyma]